MVGVETVDYPTLQNNEKQNLTARKSCEPFYLHQTYTYSQIAPIAASARHALYDLYVPYHS